VSSLLRLLFKKHDYIYDKFSWHRTNVYKVRPAAGEVSHLTCALITIWQGSYIYFSLQILAVLPPLKYIIFLSFHLPLVGVMVRTNTLNICLLELTLVAVDRFLRLDVGTRPGLSETEFLALFARCHCGLVMRPLRCRIGLKNNMILCQ
jgi:hypothetical protein